MVSVRTHRLAILAGFFVLAAGCSVEKMLAGQFSEAIFCPLDRVTVTKRPPEPPPEIAADPERLKLYMNRSEQVYLARGCGKEHVYVVSSRPDRHERRY